MTIFRADHTKSSLPGGSTSQQFTNVDFRERANPALNRTGERSRIIHNWAHITIVADPIVVTLSNLGVYGLALGTGLINLTVSVPGGLLSKWPANDRDPALDQEFDCAAQDRFGNWGQGIPVFTISLTGTWLNQTIFADPITVTISQIGDWVAATLITADPITVTIKFVPTATFFPVVVLEYAKSNWIKWSNIGSLDFTIDKTNVAGERPLDWKGWIYAIKKLESKVVVYGESGVSVLPPAGNTYGLQTIYRIGLKGKGAVAGGDSAHYFVDNLGQLWRFSERLEKLDYSEYLSSMNSGIILSWDAANRLLYICDGSQGYVFSQDSVSLGAGPTNITSIDSQSGIFYVTSPATVEIPTFEICTDIYDLGSREGKIITEIQIGTNTTKTISVAIDHRSDKADAFVQTDWHAIDVNGKAFFPVYGHEFRFRLKSSAYEYFELDYLTANGNINVIGERPLDWKEVYAAKRLGSRVVVYGDDGINVTVDGSISEVYSIQLRSKNAVVGNESIHYFIDIEGQMWSLSDSLSKLDYSEYLSLLNSSMVMSYDFENNIIYICDGALGYVYSPDSGSLGAGPVNVTGIDSQSGVLYVVSPATITTPTFEICTDIYDLGSRRGKNIYSLEIGTDLEETLEAAIEYRLDKAAAFATTDWYVVDSRGFVYLPCYGKEFRFKVKSDVYEYFELDYLTINGEICNH